MSTEQLVTPPLLQQLSPMIRWVHATQAAMLTLVSAYVGGGLASFATARPWLAALSVWCVVVYGFIINDRYDYPVDMVSKPDRPLPSGATSQPVAHALQWLFVVAALLASLPLGAFHTLLAATNLVVCGLYSSRLKNTVLVGNVTMALLDASMILFGALATGPFTPAIGWGTAMVGCFFLGYELLKTAEDAEGDGQGRLTTLATRHGVPLTIHAFRAVALVFGVVALAPWLLGHASTRYALAIVGCCVVPVLLIAALVVRHSTPSISKSLALMRLIWLTSWIPILLLR